VLWNLGMRLGSRFMGGWISDWEDEVVGLSAFLPHFIGLCRVFSALDATGGLTTRC
jgi:hypothetical protein